MAVRVELPFANRIEAGRALASRLAEEEPVAPWCVLGLPRGGVPVAFEVATALGAPLDIFLVRKLGVPGHEELAMGAIASGGVRVLNDDVVSMLGLRPGDIDRVTAMEEAELHRREEAYRDGRTPARITGQHVILIDDGLATGASMRAAAMALPEFKPAAVTVAVPVAPRESCEEIADLVDSVVCLAQPEPFYGVGLWYRDFSPTTDQEVRDLLSQAYGRSHASGGQKR
jgi:putative phosphoribosyl transferase